MPAYLSSPLCLPLCLLALQFALLLVPGIDVPVAYVSMVVAPLLAALVALRCAARQVPPARYGWWAVALSMVLWSLGAAGNLWHELVLRRFNEMYRDAMLLFAMSAVPIAFLVAREWRGAGRRTVRLIDAVLALALGVDYWTFIWAAVTARGAPDEAGVAQMVWLIDLQNVFLAIGSAVRWAASEDAAEHALYRSLAAFCLLYLGITFVNNHFVAGASLFAPQLGSSVSIAFAALAMLAMLPAAHLPPRHPDARLALAVRSASPMLLPFLLLTVSLFLIRIDYVFGAAGVIVAVLGYGLRGTATQVRHMERGESLLRERLELESIAWTDALTGIPNRHFLQQALDRAWRSERRAGQALAILMIDIDLFKPLNDRYGHPAGDACLRKVARVLHQALVRPDDVLARFGGEEFVALLRETDAAGARVVAERLRTAVEELNIAHRDSPYGVVTVSIGAASAQLDTETEVAGEVLLEAADKALYEAKCTGRNQVRSVQVLADKGAVIPV